MSEQPPHAQPNDPMRAYAALYPEVARAGSLRNALQAVVDRAGHDLTVEPTSSPGWRYVAARVAVRGRSAEVLMAQQTRAFSVDCWADGVHMATGDTADLSEAAGMMRSWVRGSRVRALVVRWPSLRTWELAEAHERGEAVPVRWRRLREAAVRTRNAALRELVEAAFAQPRLRALSPGRCMHWLTFSRRAAPPVCLDLPRVMPRGDGRYEVRFADGRVREATGAREAVQAVLDGLPDDAVPRPRNP
jgi:hypothetical protein